jgi:spheroidene monooxygenase
MLATQRVARIGGDSLDPSAPLSAESRAETPPLQLAGATAVLVLADVSPAWWGWLRLALGPRRLKGLPGLTFCKILGSGHDGGFGLRPSASRQGLFCVFEGRSFADDFLDASAEMAACRRHARELCSVSLIPYSSKGSWAGAVIPVATAAPLSGPVATLTRASIRLASARSFWRHAPAAQRALEAAQGCRLAVGLGEAPVLRQATFSIWSSVAAMNNYARQGAHLEAIRAAQQGGHFTESMFVRFVPVGLRGQWKGCSLD